MSRDEAQGPPARPNAPLAPLPSLPARGSLAPLSGSGVPLAPQIRPAPLPPLSAPPQPPAHAAAGPPQSGGPPGVHVSTDARQPADISGLVSPSKNVDGPAAGRPLNGGAAPLPIRDPPTPSNGGQHEPPDVSGPLPGAISTPTAASGAAAAAAAAAGKGAAPAAAPPMAAKRGGPKPPAAPPPSDVLEDRTDGEAKAVNDGRAVENYIPFCHTELRGKLFADHPEVFGSEETRKQFTELCKRMALRNTLRLEIDYGDAHEKYELLDPDKDTLAFKGGAPPGISLLPKGSMRDRLDAMYGELDNILDHAEFTELPPEALEKAKKDKSLMGLAVESASDEYLESRLHFRGSRLKKVEWHRWGLFKRQIEMNVYERLAVTFWLKKPVCKDDVPEDSNVGGVDTRPWYKRLCGPRASVSPSLLQLRDEFLYMKLFKDVLQCDVDMLLPGAVVKFTWIDHCLIWLPILFGCGCAVWKAVKGSIRFNNLMDAILSVVLIVMPLTWGIRAYMAIREKQRLHQAHLNALFITHNLNNNSGVVSQLLNEVQEQEDNETMLAYFFLWKGSPQPQPKRKLELDREVERYLQGKLDELGVHVRQDFEVVESIVRLERMGVVCTRGQGPDKTIQALPLAEALEKAHVRNFDEARETGHKELPRTQARLQGSVALRWHEFVDIFRPTGQKFRYFWNSETGESTYLEPDEPYIKLGAEKAVDFEKAYDGDALDDPLKRRDTNGAGGGGGGGGKPPPPTKKP